jgi:hypothetical protein
MTDKNELPDRNQDSQQEAWLRLRGILKDVYAEYGGGEAYLRKEREGFFAPNDSRYRSVVQKDR